MTVVELIELLQEFPEEYDVNIPDGGGYFDKINPLDVQCFDKGKWSRLDDNGRVNIG